MIFIDTGAFIARYFKQDQFHKRAINQWKKLEKTSKTLITTNFVLDETFTLLARRSYYSFAVEKANLIYSSPSIRILRPDLESELNAVKLFDKFSDQKISFTDCISFQLMKENRIKEVFTFDKHFKFAGFKIV